MAPEGVQLNMPGASRGPPPLVVHLLVALEIPGQVLWGPRGPADVASAWQVEPTAMAPGMIDIHLGTVRSDIGQRQVARKKWR